MKLFLLLLLVLGLSYIVSDNVEQDHLQVLGLAPPFYQFWEYETPSENDVKAAYKAQSLLYHPDKNDQPDASEKFYAIRKAYEELKGSSPDSERRRNYAASKYAHHGQLLRDLRYHWQNLPVYRKFIYDQYLRVMWWYIVALTKEFIDNPRNSWNRFWFNVNLWSLKEGLVALLGIWIVWKICSFILYVISNRIKAFFAISDTEKKRRQKAAYLRKQHEL